MVLDPECRFMYSEVFGLLPVLLCSMRYVQCIFDPTELKFKIQAKKWRAAVLQFSQWRLALLKCPSLETVVESCVLEMRPLLMIDKSAVALGASRGVFSLFSALPMCPPPQPICTEALPTSPLPSWFAASVVRRWGAHCTLCDLGRGG